MSASEQNNMEKEFENIENQDSPIEDVKPAVESEELPIETEPIISDDLSEILAEVSDEDDIFSEKIEEVSDDDDIFSDKFEEVTDITEEDSEADVISAHITDEVIDTSEEDSVLTEILNKEVEEAPETLFTEEIENFESEESVSPIISEPLDYIVKGRVELKPEKVLIVQNDKKSNKRILQGKVVSNKSEKSILVLIERHIAHPLYKKYFKRSRKVMAHDPNNECREGDTVKVIEFRPLSARKRWHLLEIVERAK
jgi:small subunit ribosomal protein S17